MRTALSLAIVLALGASPVLAKTAYCTDTATHKRVTCKIAARPPLAAPTARPAAKPGLFARKPAAVAMTASRARPTHAAVSGKHVHKGKKCGNSYIAANRVCHKG